MHTHDLKEADKESLNKSALKEVYDAQQSALNTVTNSGMSGSYTCVRIVEELWTVIKGCVRELVEVIRVLEL
jgi:hypothetical protein